MRRHVRTIAALLAFACVGITLGGMATWAETPAVEIVPPGGNLAPRVDIAEAILPASALPGGASSLSETYQDWLVSCATQAATKRCAFSQNQSQKDGQRVLAIELAAPAENAVNGILLLPFGLSLEAGISLQIDDKPVGQQLRFRTCLPAGCVVPLNFDALTLTRLRAGATLQIGATVDGGAAAPAFAVSLLGFGAALDRVASIAR